MEKCAQCRSKTNLRRCSRCLQTSYCSKKCQVQHWEQHKKTCSKSSSEQREQNIQKPYRISEHISTGAHVPYTARERQQKCAQCGSKTSLRRCTGCLAVWYCSRECQTQDWGKHKPLCKKEAGKEKGRQEPSSEGKSASSQALLRQQDAFPVPPWVTFQCLTCGYRGKNMINCERCNAKMAQWKPPSETGFSESMYTFVMWTDEAGGPIHAPVHMEYRKAEAAKRVAEAKRLAGLRNENCRLTKQDEGDVIVTPVLTWEEARSRASLLFPKKRIVDKFSDLEDDRLVLPDSQNVVSISKIKEPYPHPFRVARRLQDADGKMAYMICYNEGAPEPYFGHDQLVEGNFFCMDHAHLHIFSDQSVGFRVDWPWDVHVMEP